MRPIGRLETHGARRHADPRHDRVRLRAGDRRAAARARPVRAREPPRRACAVRRRGCARRVAGRVPEPRTRRDRGRVVRRRPARAAIARSRPASISAIKQTHPARAGRSPASTRDDARVSSRPSTAGPRSAARRRTRACTHLIAELKARGLKVTLYPFVMMDIPAGNALPDPWTGAASQPAYPWRGRITCDPAPGQPGSPDGTARGRRRRSMRSSATGDPGRRGATAAWCCTTRSLPRMRAASTRS